MPLPPHWGFQRGPPARVDFRFRRSHTLLLIVEEVNHNMSLFPFQLEAYIDR